MRVVALAAITLTLCGSMAYAAGITGTENNNNNSPSAYGGDGGNGYGGAGGNATNRNNISTEVKNANTNVSGASVRDSGNSSSRSTSSADATVTKSGNSASVSTVRGSGNSRQSQKQSQGNSQNLTIEGDEYKMPRGVTSSAIAPTIFTANPCMGAASVGVSGQFFGFSGGKSMIDESCNRRENAKLVTQLAGTKEGLAVLCADESLKIAIGKKCPKDVDVAVVPTKKPTPARKCQFPNEANCAG